jgi:hypothetical protein
METQEKTVAVKHKKNGIKREFSETQNKLMGKKNRKMFSVDTPEEADLEKQTQETEVQKLQRENQELQALLAAAQNPAPVQEEGPAKTEEQLQAEGLRVQNNDLKAAITSETSSLQTTTVVEQGAADGDDPNPELTALRLKYQEVTGNKPGRLGTDKLQAGIDEAEKLNKQSGQQS